MPVKPLRVIQPPGLMMPQGGGEHLLNTRRCLLPQVFSPIDSPWAGAGSLPAGERRWSAVSYIYS
jgi:hypothetical protein